MDLDNNSEFDEKFGKNHNKDNFKNALCYIPFVAVVFFFTENNKTKEFEKNIKYGIFLLIAYVILNAFLGFGYFRGLIFIIYAGISGFLGYKAYSGEKIEIEVLDKMEKTVKEKMNEQPKKTENTTESNNKENNQNEL